MTYQVQKNAALKIDEIYLYTQKNWGKKQAVLYVEGLFNTFQNIVDNEHLSRPIPAVLEVKGYFYKYQKHIIYWRYLSPKKVGIMTILHERMHQIEALKNVGFDR